MGDVTVQSLKSPPLDWNKFVNDHSKAKLYHFHEWLHVIQHTFNHSINYITINVAGKIKGILPLIQFDSFFFGKFAVSLPFVNYGGALVSHEEFYKPLFEHVSEFCKEQRLEFIELRYDWQLNSALPCKTHKVTFHLQLTSEEELWSSFKSKVRSQVRRPLKENMYEKIGGVALLKDFYEVFAVNMKRLGTPVLPIRFFENILSQFKDHAFIGIVYSSQNRPVASSFLIKYRDRVEIPWASSLSEYNRFSPNMLLYWASIKFALENQCKVFDFGRCTPGSGTYKFKKQWGARELPLFWYYILPENGELPEINPQNSKYSLAIQVWKKLPVSLTKLIGPSIIKHIP
ncbi:MAG: FemAB family PEP-CTERM system-associated protein [Nitrosopumilaceae archaeon]|nr:FemAB family PEP-CTERM system-associated protein [Nitrosopumilaceae archaeon]NIX63272.1 FemAB family PEP-CTERM system-associated protein [Nitrosopumilaceae archaeon]